MLLSQDFIPLTGLYQLRVESVDIENADAIDNYLHEEVKIVLRCW